MRKWKDEHPGYFEEKGRLRRKVRTDLVYAAKDVPCADCGVKYPPYVMDFDHRPGEVKLFNVGQSRSGRPLEDILLEIKKCDVVCSNCHRERTHQRSISDGE